MCFTHACTTLHGQVCDLSSEDVCIMGTEGMLLRGPRIKRHEDYVYATATQACVDVCSLQASLILIVTANPGEIGTGGGVFVPET